MLWSLPFANGIMRTHTMGGFSAPLPDWVGMWQSPSSVTVGNTASETALLTGAVALGSLTIPANYMTPGTMLQIMLRGFLTTAVAVPTLQIRITLGGTAVFSTGAISLGAAQIATATRFEAAYLVGAQTIGAAGTIVADGVWWTANLTTPGLAPATAQSGTINTTTTEALSVLATWGTADPANTLTLTSAVVEIAG
jgi:hypothetical protein